MSVALLLPIDAGADTPPRKKFTREEVECLAEQGFFEGQRYELIDGDLVDKMGQNPPHAFAIQLLTFVLGKLFGVRVRGQLSLEMPTPDRDRSLPEPDIAVLAECKPEYARRHPRGDECLLVVEVSDTTVRFDLSRKAALYARAGVPEYWVLDLNERRLFVHRQPRDGAYRSIQFFTEGETASLEGRAEAIAVADLLPTAPDKEQ